MMNKASKPLTGVNFSWKIRVATWYLYLLVTEPGTLMHRHGHIKVNFWLF